MDHKFKEGDLDYAKLKPYQQVSVSRNASQKLVGFFYNPFKVILKNTQSGIKAGLTSN